MGFPTANIVMHDDSIPDGVWAARVTLPDFRVLPAVVSVGCKPSFGEASERLLESHIIDFAEDLYGLHITVALMKYLRKQVRFNLLADLTSAMCVDRKRASAVLSEHRETASTGGALHLETPRMAPNWAVGRVRSALAAKDEDLVTVPELSTRLGMSKGLVRSCLRVIRGREQLSISASV